MAGSQQAELTLGGPFISVKEQAQAHETVAARGKLW